MAQVRDMTEGKPIKLMLGFSVPLLISNALFMLFTIADSAIIGRILGVNAFAAIGATQSPHWMVLSAVFGFNIGFGTLFAQRFGAKDMPGLRKAVVTAVYFAIIIGVIIGVGGWFGARPLMLLLNTPQGIIDGAVQYISLLWAGKILMVCANLCSTVLFALGNSKTPLYGSILAFIANIIFDFALIIPFGIPGVAIASLLSQAVSMLYVFRAIRKTGIFHGCGYKFDKKSAWPLLRLAIPLGFRNGIVEFGGLFVQRYINSFGVEFVAGIAAAKRMYSLLMIGGGAIEASIATFVAQNFGAGKLDRVKEGVKDGLKLALISSGIMMLITLPLGRQILSLLIAGEAVQVNAVLDIGVRQLNLMALGLPFLYLLFLYRAALQGIGNTFIPMLSGFIEAGLRVILVIVMTGELGQWGVMLSDPLPWPFAMILLIVSYLIIFKRLSKQMEEQDI